MISLRKPEGSFASAAPFSIFGRRLDQSWLSFESSIKSVVPNGVRLVKARSLVTARPAAGRRVALTPIIFPSTGILPATTRHQNTNLLRPSLSTSSDYLLTTLQNTKTVISSPTTALLYP